MNQKDITTHSEIAVITFNVIPEHNYMFKYERLGKMAIENRRLYCQRHGITFIDDIPIDKSRPACWSKIPAILQAFESHKWVLWADSDALIFDHSRSLLDFCDPEYDLIVQSHDEFFKHIGLDPKVGLKKTPINTGVFLIKSSAWSQWFLNESYKQSQFITDDTIWEGIGEQEAMIEVLNQHPDDLKRIAYVQHLQNHPKFYNKADMFVHFYGHYTKHHIPLPECEEILNRWETANQVGSPYPEDIARFHWCCIQNKSNASPVLHGDLGRYLYTLEDIKP